MLSVRNIDKWFGATHAVRTVSFEANAASVLGLVGENGAGKSTIIKMIGGLVPPDRGEILLNGKQLALRSPREALAAGIDAVFQELALVDNLSVAENLLLLEPPLHPWRSVRRGRFHASAASILARYELAIPPIMRVGNLPLGQRQMLEIVRAVHRDPRVLILDEATSALGQREVMWLARLVKKLREMGKIILFISHRWEEIATFCDRVAVMRNGALVEVADAATLSQERAVELMTGHGLAGTFPAKTPSPEGTLLAVRHLQSATLRDISFSLAPGEVLGLGGLVGQGQSELLRALFGAHPLRQGVITLGRQPVAVTGPRAGIAAGIAYVPQERKSEGLFLNKSVAFNMTYAVLDRLAAFCGIIARGAEQQTVGEAIGRLNIRASGPGVKVQALSGGNQQKVLLQKWLLTGPRVLLLDDVTRGVDIGTKQQIYEIIRATAARGTGIIFYSTDTGELVGLADRVLVMVEGRIQRSLAGAAIEQTAIIEAAIGQGAGGEAVH